jgi:hypothetical protein
MGVNNSNHTHAFPLDIAHPFEVDYITSNGIPDPLGARRIASLQNYFIKLIKQIFRQGNAYSH